MIAGDAAGNESAASSEVAAIPVLLSGATGRLNDTGATTCSDDTNSNLTCPVVGYPGQDAESGRDVTNNDDSDGHAGFSFTKISISGERLPNETTKWSCVKDNVTGLTWEVKTNDGGLHEFSNTYSWYEPNQNINGGTIGVRDGGICFGSSCDTYSFINQVNESKLCGKSNWRLPNYGESINVYSDITQLQPWFFNVPTSYNIAYRTVGVFQDSCHYLINI